MAVGTERGTRGKQKIVWKASSRRLYEEGGGGATVAVSQCSPLLGDDDPYGSLKHYFLTGLSVAGQEHLQHLVRCFVSGRTADEQA